MKTKSPTSNESKTCQVYAIRLRKSVLNNQKFVDANPGYRTGYPLYYVGMTSLDPVERHAQHAGGVINASKIASPHMADLDMSVVTVRKPTLRTWVLKHERQLAQDLRAKGCGVWQA